jgi:opacity protein-like surface antigen
MIKRYSTFLLALPLLTLAASSLQAQNYSKHDRYRSVGVSLNGLSYFGDITPERGMSGLRLGSTRPGIALTATQRFTERISARVAFSYGRIKGQDVKAIDDHDASAPMRYARNINFRNDITELSATGVFDLIENWEDYLRRPDFVPYVFAGVAVFHHNPKGFIEGGTVPEGLTERTYVALQPLRTEGQSAGYSRTQFALPFGGGVRYRINKEMDVSLEIGWRKTFTDYLDDVSGTYTDVSKLTSPEALYFGHDVTRDDSKAMPGQARGNNQRHDWYMVTGVTVQYIVPQFRNTFKLR